MFVEYQLHFLGIETFFANSVGARFQIDPAIGAHCVVVAQRAILGLLSSTIWFLSKEISSCITCILRSSSMYYTNRNVNGSYRSIQRRGALLSTFLPFLLLQFSYCEWIRNAWKTHWGWIGDTLRMYWGRIGNVLGTLGRRIWDELGTH